MHLADPGLVRQEGPHNSTVLACATRFGAGASTGCEFALVSAIAMASSCIDGGISAVTPVAVTPDSTAAQIETLWRADYARQGHKERPIQQ